ncbi:MAG: hypothetical protein LBK54_06025 [Propionibacteriaceae bacterium]|nr:hypothetical protein [Propionibacteriaceae bacterium]
MAVPWAARPTQVGVGFEAGCGAAARSSGIGGGPVLARIRPVSAQPGSA